MSERERERQTHQVTDTAPIGHQSSMMGWFPLGQPISHQRSPHRRQQSSNAKGRTLVCTPAVNVGRASIGHGLFTCSSKRSEILLPAAGCHAISSAIQLEPAAGVCMHAHKLFPAGSYIWLLSDPKQVRHVGEPVVAAGRSSSSHPFPGYFSSE